MRVVPTDSGAVAMHDAETGEVMHPIVGPLVEGEELYVRPARLRERLAEDVDAPLVLFDVGLGAGTNAALAIRVSEGRPVDPGRPSRRLHVVSFERAFEAFDLARSDEHADAFGFDAATRDAATIVRRDGRYVSARTTWELVAGELPGTLASTGLAANVVFWDPWSPKSNPDLWNVTTFSALAEVCADDVTVHTYSGATAMRAAMLLAGFAVGTGGLVSFDPDASALRTKSERTTVAARDPSRLEHPLGPRWLGTLRRSTVPFTVDVIDREAALAAIASRAQFRDA
ncbi:MAG: MnmC family methyltransferase [Polyangiaceae bacterium]